jgi:acetyltransferase-like isoleucine patch superfamily enzyme
MIISLQRNVFLHSCIHKGVTIGNSVTVEPLAVIYDGCELGNNVLVGTGSVLRHNTKIGDNSIFGTLSVSEGGCVIGKSCTIHSQCHITKGVTIGDDVFIAPFFCASNTPNITKGHHGTHTERETYEWLPTIIEDRVRIGIYVSMIPGCTIGHDSLITQNCLITKDIPPYSIVKARGKNFVGTVIGDTRNDN